MSVNHINKQSPSDAGVVKVLKILLERCDSRGLRKFCCSEKDCTSSFRTRNALRHHHVRVHNAVYVKCPREGCSKSVKSFALEQHIRQIHERIRIPCKHCGKVVKYEKISRHLASCTSNGIKKFKCTFEGCKSSFVSNERLSAHVKIVHSFSVLKCPHKNCNVYVRSTRLVWHLKSKHDKVQESCDNCGKVLSYQGLYNHLPRCKITGERNFHCTIKNCESKFAHRMGLTEHLRFAHAAPVKCPREDCDAYLNPKKVSRHLKEVHDAPRKTCDHCGRLMLVKSLEKHMEKCSSRGERSFFCEIGGCMLSFAKRCLLDQHVKWTHEETVKCPRENCNVWVKPRGISLHLKRIHDSGKDRKLESRQLINFDRQA